MIAFIMIEFGHFIVQVSYAVNACLGLSYSFGKFNYQRIFGFLFLIVAFIQFQFELIYTKDLFYHPIFFLTYIPAILWFGPLLYYLFLRIIFNQSMSKLNMLKHFLVPTIATVSLIPIFLIKADNKIKLINALFYSNSTMEYIFLSFICVSSVFFYITILFTALPTIQRMKTKTSFSYILFSILIFAIIISGFAFAGQLTHSLTFLYAGNVLFSCCLLLTYVLHLRFPHFLTELMEEIRLSKTRQTHLTSVNINKALANLNYVIHEEKIYLDPDLTLGDMAGRLNLTNHQLSELLNNEVGKNFNSFIMDFRIKDAIEKLKTNQTMTISAIASSVGFNSHSAFYSAFKRITGKSPSDYLAE